MHRCLPSCISLRHDIIDIVAYDRLSHGVNFTFTSPNPLSSLFVYLLYNSSMGLKPYLGLRGNALLRAAVALVVFPTFTCYGYNMSVAGGLLTLPDFNEQFPRMDTINTEGALKAENSTIQGWSILG